MLISDAFSAVHMIAPHMQQAGYDSRLIIANCQQSQIQWMKENGTTKLRNENWVKEIARKQIEEYEPEILYLSNPIVFEGSFIRSLRHKPKLILGWRAATAPYDIDWSGFDIMLSSLGPLLEFASQRGVKHTELFSPGFPAFIAERIKEIKPSNDIVFVGQYTSSQHAKRGHYLQEIAKASEAKGHECALHLSGHLDQVPSCLKKYLAEPAYGLAMHKALRKGRIAFDARADHFIVDPKKNIKNDIGGKDTANMRIFETTGSGVFLLTEHFENLAQFFSIGDEIETFSDRKELIEKLDYFLAHPEKRNEIAARGQARCLKDHSMERRVQKLDRIIRKHLALKDTSKDSPYFQDKKSPDSMSSKHYSNLMIKVQHAIDNKDFPCALRITSEIKAKKYNTQNIDYYRAIAFCGMNQLQSAIEAVKEELRHYPDNLDASSFLRTLYSQNNIIDHNHKNIGEFEKIYSHIKLHTMLGRDRLVSLFTIAKKCCEHDLPGNFVECGVAAGGSSALLAWVIKTYSKRPRVLYCFDTFEGMPDPTIEDSHASTPANDTGWGAGTCAAPMQSLLDISDKLGVADIIRPTKGLFKNTLPQKSNEIGQIALLHMDGDWYESTLDILENLYEQVLPRGYIQVDDYGHWDGCKKALHEYESKLDLKFDLHRIDNTGVWFRKPDSPADTTRSRLLNLGCGKRHHPAWTNVDFKSAGLDVIAHDLSKGLPFSDESFEAVYHSHLLEHFSKNYAPVFLKDCFRVLKPGGIIRVVVPDLESIVRLYLILLEKSVKGDEEARKRYDWIMLELFDQMVRNHSGGAMLEYWRQTPMPAEEFVIERVGSEVKNTLARIRSNSDSKKHSREEFDHTLDPATIAQFRLSGEIHQWMYDRYSLGKLLQEAGFEDIKVCEADESQIPDFNSYLLDIEPDGSVRKPDSLFMEAKKPNEQNTKTIRTHDNSEKRPVIAQFCMQDFGGAGTAALRLHEGLTRIGTNNTFFVQNIGKWRDKTALLSQSHPSSENEKFISPEWRAFQTANHQALSQYPYRPSGVEMFSIPWAATKLKDIFELQNADIINLHWISGTLSVADNVDFLKGKKIVWTLHDMNPFTGGCHYAGECRGYEKYCGNCPQLGSNQENDLSREIWKTKKLAYRELDIEVVVLCDWMAKCVKQSSLLSSFPVHVIPNGLPTDIFKPYPQDQIRDSLQIPKDAFVILFGANTVTNARKGFVHLVGALERLIKLSPSGQFALATFGNHAQAAVQHLGLPTFAFNYVDKESELALIYSMADVTVIPSLEDNLPNVVLESLACGTPVVGFDVGGIPDMIEHQINGYLAPTGDVNELAQGIRWIMDQKKTRSQIRLKCRETTLSRYNLPLQAQRYQELYEICLQKVLNFKTQYQSIDFQ